jgi:hypothetical protein
MLDEDQKKENEITNPTLDEQKEEEMGIKVPLGTSLLDPSGN